MNHQSQPPSGSDDSADREWDELVREFAAPPPLPSESAWRGVRGRIAAQVMPSSTRPRPRPRHHRLQWVAALAASALVGLTVWAFVTRPNTQTLPQPAFDPLAEYDVLPIATPNDVMVSDVRGGIEFASIDHPLSGVMTLAEGNEFSTVRPWTGELSQPTPADAAMLMDR